MEMHQVRYFLEVCDTLNFTRASERCNISQPALTKAIQRLEETLGGQLFDRSKNMVVLTDFGSLMQPSMRELYDIACKAKAQAQALVSDKVQRLRIGIMCTIGFRRLAPFLAMFEDLNPNIQISYDDGTLMQLHDKLDKGQLDLAISSTPYELPRRFKGMPLFDENFHIAFPSGHRFEKLQTIPMSEMHGEVYVSRMNCEYSDLLTEMMSKQGVAVRIRHQTPREDWIQEMILVKMGVAFIPESMPLHSELLTRTVCAPDVVRTINILTVSEQNWPQEVNDFVTAARQYDWRAAVRPSSRVA